MNCAFLVPNYSLAENLNTYKPLNPKFLPEHLLIHGVCLGGGGVKEKAPCTSRSVALVTRWFDLCCRYELTCVYLKTSKKTLSYLV